ncbi:MAG: redoxin domain-containing protein [Phycisphaerales bacterium]|nr:redoxin domain-containing protein [Phycisphaerales bacterium]
MRRTTALFASLTLCMGTAGLLAGTSAPAPTAMTAPAAKIGEAAPAFTLKDLSGKEHSLKDFKGKIVVLEWFCSGCPWSGSASGKSVHSTGQVKNLMTKMKAVDSDVVYLLIDSTANMSKDKVISTDKKLKSKYDLKAPILIDYDGTVGKAFGARTTPHMFVIDKEGVLRYQGAFSDKGDKNYVLDAVTAVSEGKAPEPATTRAWGCGVKYKRR